MQGLFGLQFPGLEKLNSLVQLLFHLLLGLNLPQNRVEFDSALGGESFSLLLGTPDESTRLDSRLTEQLSLISLIGQFVQLHLRLDRLELGLGPCSKSTRLLLGLGQEVAGVKPRLSFGLLD